MYQEYIDIYCERVGPEFWAEPLNAVSNIAIIIAALLLIPVLRRQISGASRDPAHWLLIGLVFLIGVGSGLFHTLAVRWAMWADVIPITLFTITYAYFALRRFLLLGVGVSLLWTAVMLALTLGLPVVTGSQGSTYLPALVGMLAPEYREQIIGLAEVKDVFKSPQFGAVAGSIVTEGVIKRNQPIRVLRDNVVIYEGELESLRRFKDDVQEVKSGTECGIAVKNYNDVKVGDQIEVYERVQQERTL